MPIPASPELTIHTPSDYSFPAHDTLTVATWNVEHFVDTHDNPYIDNQRENTPDVATVEKRLEWFAQGLRAIDADVLVLQEFESTVFAQALADTLVPDLGYRFVTGTDKGSWYQNVVILSRLPLGPVQSFAAAFTPIEGQSDDDGTPANQMLTNHRMFSAEVLVRPGTVATVIGAHLKAGRGDRNAGWRMGQIRALHKQLTTIRVLAPDRTVVVAGDLNLLPDSPEYSLLLNVDRTQGPVAFIDALPDGMSGYTHASDDLQRRLDYVLHNAEMAPHLIDIEVLQPLPAAVMPDMSDHLPVRARYRVQ